MDDFLRAAMRDRGWKVPQFAEAVDVNVGLAARWVSANPRYRVTPGPASCEKIAEALGLDPDYVLELAGHRHVRSSDQPADPEAAELQALVLRVPPEARPTVRSMLLGLVRSKKYYPELAAA